MESQPGGILVSAKYHFICKERCFKQISRIGEYSKVYLSQLPHQNTSFPVRVKNQAYKEYQKHVRLFELEMVRFQNPIFKRETEIK